MRPGENRKRNRGSIHDLWRFFGSLRRTLITLAENNLGVPLGVGKAQMRAGFHGTNVFTGIVTVELITNIFTDPFSSNFGLLDSLVCQTVAAGMLVLELRSV
jgi:hypothetical protein